MIPRGDQSIFHSLSHEEFSRKWRKTSKVSKLDAIKKGADAL